VPDLRYRRYTLASRCEGHFADAIKVRIKLEEVLIIRSLKGGGKLGA